MRRHDDKTDLGNLVGMLWSVDVPEPTEADRQKARLAVCSYAEDATVARELLDALGLLT